jgi:hypothetical protein
MEVLRSRASICGHVTDAATGRGIALALVALPELGVSTRTRPDGFFYFGDLQSGAYQLQAAAPQLGGRYGAISVAEVEVKTDDKGRPVFDPRANVALSPTCVSGAVADSGTGNPIAAAVVRIRASEISAQTGKSGQYILSPLQPGAATVEVLARGYQSATRPVSLTGGQQVTADFSLTKA